MRAFATFSALVLAAGIAFAAADPTDGRRSGRHQRIDRTAATDAAERLDRDRLDGRTRVQVFGSGTSMDVRAIDAHRVRRTTGPVVSAVRGVPAQPVDSAVWDGDGVVSVPGELSMRVDPLGDVARIEATWTDEHGEWTYLQSRVAVPEAPGGIRVGSSRTLREELTEPVLHNVWLFGDTGAVDRMLPTAFSHVAVWGPAEVTLDGEPFLNPVRRSRGVWQGEVFVTEGTRRPDGSVRAVGGDVFDRSQAANGEVEPFDLELHLRFHDGSSAATSNLPANRGFFYNLVFEAVSVDTLHLDSAPDRDRSSLPSSDPLPPIRLENVPPGPVRYQAVAGFPRLNRRPKGPAIVEVQGVAAEPVDSFVWNGDGSTRIDGELLFEVSPGEEEGIVQVTWNDRNGEWIYFQQRFIHPEHSSGIRIGEARDSIYDFLNEGITNNVYLHGDTTAGMPVLPTVFNQIATWGPADVLRNGELFASPFEIPAPQWIGHLMLTEGVRDHDGTVRAVDGTIYNPTKGAMGAVQRDDVEIHMVFHDERFPMNSNTPPLFSFFYHLVFEDVRLRILQVDE